MRLVVGCSGFSYSAWRGHFYPPDLPSAKWLSYYSKVFDFVEIDSTYYRMPNALTVRKWAKNTPDNFRFSAKMPGKITHKKRLGDVDSDMQFFYDAMAPLKEKTAAILIQLPASIVFKEGFRKMKNLPFDDRFRHAIEVRHVSWFDDDFYDFLIANNICLVWSQRDEIAAPPKVTADFTYLRFIGDRSIREDFGRIQKDRLKEMQYWAGELKKHEALKTGIIAANNHYAGFGPGTANTFRKMLGVPEARFYEIDQKEQASLLDYSQNP